jgi:hypothetical protein
MKKKSKIIVRKRAYPRVLSWVKIDPELEEEYGSRYADKLGRTKFLIYMGEIPNQPGHCIVFNQDTQKMHVGYHIETFVEMTEDEV